MSEGMWLCQPSHPLAQGSAGSGIWPSLWQVPAWEFQGEFQLFICPAGFMLELLEAVSVAYCLKNSPELAHSLAPAVRTFGMCKLAAHTWVYVQEGAQGGVLPPG